MNATVMGDHFFPSGTCHVNSNCAKRVASALFPEQPMVPVLAN